MSFSKPLAALELTRLDAWSTKTLTSASKQLVPQPWTSSMSERFTPRTVSQFETRQLLAVSSPQREVALRV
jgi:hypothetical protein